MVDRDGVVHYAPNIPPFLRCAACARSLADATGRPVAIDNDANVAALAELTHGAAAGYSTTSCS